MSMKLSPPLLPRLVSSSAFLCLSRESEMPDRRSLSFFVVPVLGDALGKLGRNVVLSALCFIGRNQSYDMVSGTSQSLAASHHPRRRDTDFSDYSQTLLVPCWGYDKMELLKRVVFARRCRRFWRLNCTSVAVIPRVQNYGEVCR